MARKSMRMAGPFRFDITESSWDLHGYKVISIRVPPHMGQAYRNHLKQISSQNVYKYKSLRSLLRGYLNLNIIKYSSCPDTKDGAHHFKFEREDLGMDESVSQVITRVLANFFESIEVVEPSFQELLVEN